MTNALSPGFWNNKKVLITGHTGFKGSWLSLWLQSLGAQVTGYALAPLTHPNLFDAARVSEGMRSVVGDIRDLEALRAVVRASQPEIVIHMAAQPLVLYSYRYPVETYATNVMGTVHLMEAVREAGCVRALVNVTTDKCYENREWIWGYRENEPMGGSDPYSNSKACSELVTQAFRHSFFGSTDTAVASARAGNVIGGGDWAENRLIPDILTAFEQKRPVVIRHPGAIRPWQHVLESLCGYLTLAERLYSEGQPFAQAWNFGPNSSDVQPVQWIVESMVEQWRGLAKANPQDASGYEASWVTDSQTYPHEAHYLKLDISKALNHLSWQPRWDLKTALNQIVAWHNAWLNQSDPKQLCLDQITSFTNAGSYEKQ